MAWLYALAVTVALLAGLLAVPVRIGFTAAVDGSAAGLQKGGRIRWAFGLVELPLGGKPRTEGPRPVRPRGKPKPRPSRLDRSRLLRNPAFWSRAKRLLGRILREIRWQAFRLDARVGLEDPADTGMLWGLLGPVIASTVPPLANVTIRPNFERAELAFESDGEIRVIPLRVLWVLVAFLASPQTWRVLRPAWRRPA